MIIEWGTTSGSSSKQRVYGLCGLNDRGTLKTKICVFFSFPFYFFFLFFSLRFIEIIINIICK